MDFAGALWLAALGNLMSLLFIISKDEETRPSWVRDGGMEHWKRYFDRGSHMGLGRNLVLNKLS